MHRGSFIDVDPPADQVARQRQLRIESVHRASLVTHPGGVSLRIDDPKREVGRFRREIYARLALAQHLLGPLPLDRDSGDVGRDLGQSKFLRMRTAVFLAVHRERTQNFAVR